MSGQSMYCQSATVCTAICFPSCRLLTHLTIPIDLLNDQGSYRDAVSNPLYLPHQLHSANHVERKINALNVISSLRAMSGANATSVVEVKK